jgi:ABC-type phosphate transport system auxiliary subunit
MSKALLQQQAAKVLQDIAEHQQQLHAAQQAANVQAIAQANNENNVLRAEVDRLHVELHNHEVHEVQAILSPILPAYEDAEVSLSGTDA